MSLDEPSPSVIEYITLDARGTLIKVPKDIIFKAPVISTLYNNKKITDTFYLNFSPIEVHDMIDYLSGYPCTFSAKTMHLLEFCGIEEKKTTQSVTIECLYGETLTVDKEMVDTVPALREFYESNSCYTKYTTNLLTSQVKNYLQYMMDKPYKLTADFASVCDKMNIRYSPDSFKLIKEEWDQDRNVLYTFEIENTKQYVYVININEQDERNYDYHNHYYYYCTEVPSITNLHTDSAIYLTQESTLCCTGSSRLSTKDIISVLEKKLDVSKLKYLPVGL
jgi:uncharacterized pyridoxamine 5'-phosphate oxidase family protein